MVQGFKHIAIIGAGAAGCVCAYYILKAGLDVTLFDKEEPLLTLLPTGGGRCNLAHAEYDFKELAKNYPRGEKFLYSVFSKFGTAETLSLFDEFGIDTYTQADGRIFPTSNSSKQVREALLAKIKNADFIKETVIEISEINEGFKLKTNKAQYLFSDIVISTGGFCKNKNIKGLKNNIIPPKPSLVGLNSNINAPSGIVLENVYSKDIQEYGNILFTHFGVSGPLIYKISSIKAGENFPFTLTFDLINEDMDFQKILDKNSHKDLKNILSDFFPHRFAEWITCDLANKKGHEINGKERDAILGKIHNFDIQVSGTNIGEETVTAGGYDLKEISSKTMQSRIHKNLYIIGEALDIDGFCGGFNLQNAWATAFIAAYDIIEKRKSFFNE